MVQLLGRSRRSGTARSMVARQGRVLGGYLHKEESGEEAKGNSGVELGGTHVEAMTA
jgi:hypothetical protein